MSVHSNIRCDSCRKCPIVGNRYKCFSCPNINLCDDCESQDLHYKNHALIKIRDSSFFANSIYFQNRSNFIHMDCSCSVCGMSPVVGFLYRCDQCSLNICEMCDLLGGGDHNSTHPVVRHLHPTNIPTPAEETVPKQKDSKKVASGFPFKIDSIPHMPQRRLSQPTYTTANRLISPFASNILVKAPSPLGFENNYARRLSHPIGYSPAPQESVNHSLLASPTFDSPSPSLPSQLPFPGFLANNTVTIAPPTAGMQLNNMNHKVVSVGSRSQFLRSPQGVLAVVVDIPAIWANPSQILTIEESPQEAEGSGENQRLRIYVHYGNGPSLTTLMSKTDVSRFLERTINSCTSQSMANDFQSRKLVDAEEQTVGKAVCFPTPVGLQKSFLVYTQSKSSDQNFQQQFQQLHHQNTSQQHPQQRHSHQQTFLVPKTMYAKRQGSVRQSSQVRSRTMF